MAFLSVYNPPGNFTRFISGQVSAPASDAIVQVASALNLPKRWRIHSGATVVSAIATSSGVVCSASGQVSISNIAISNPAQITTASDHGLSSGEVVFIANPDPAATLPPGYYTVTVTSATVFTVPINETVGGSSGEVALNAEPIFRYKSIVAGAVTNIATSSVGAAGKGVYICQDLNQGADFVLTMSKVLTD